MAENVFIQTKDGKVVNSLVITQELIDTGRWGDPSEWTQVEQEDTDGDI